MKKEKKKNYVRTRYAESSPEHQFGTRLIKEMEKKGLSTSKLAEIMNISEATVSQWRQHYTIPKQAHLDELCRIFAPCSADYFLGTIDAPNYDVKFITEYTGLSAAAVQYLHDLNACSSSPEVKEESKRMYREMSGTDMHPDFLDVLNKLLSSDSGFTELIHALKDAGNAQAVVDELEEYNDGIERSININLQKEPPVFNPPSAESEMFFIEMNSELQRLNSMLSANYNGITAETAANDLVIRKFYNVLEKFTADITVKKWTYDYLNGINARINQYMNELDSRRMSAAKPIDLSDNAIKTDMKDHTDSRQQDKKNRPHP